MTLIFDFITQAYKCQYCGIFLDFFKKDLFIYVSMRLALCLYLQSARVEGLHYCDRHLFFFLNLFNLLLFCD